MSKKTQAALDEIYEDNAFQENMDVIAISPDGKKKYPYYNIKTYKTLQKIVDYRKGWELKIYYK